MSRIEEIEAQARRVEASLPDYVAIRELAARALTATAEDLGLELAEQDARDLAVAVVNAVHKPAELHGILLACRVAENEVDANERYLLPKVREDAKAGDSIAREVLGGLELFAEGVEKVRGELTERLARVGRQWLAAQPGTADARTEAKAGG